MQALQPLDTARTPPGKLFRCNSCAVELPIEELRVRERNPGLYLKYHGVYGHLQAQGKHLDYPECFQEILLCDDCKRLYNRWKKDFTLNKPKHGRIIVDLTDLATWSRAYWKQRFQQAAAANGVLPL